MKRIAALRTRDNAKRTAQQWTPMLDAETWTVLAMPMQAALCTDTQADDLAPDVVKTR